ncbi:glycine--tRNA ligase [Rhodohalobacter sulfatireducens]|uniref:Glycine--tRNA ligase n=1 Tax=Rhodohalobacter sulfatireducens TaxID=2911366 RepID=A0ABS9K9N6_9BACT|nr:glycine--tRNA ligase [Rhodohalobacter sulfatireducens]MCG2587551.1 glycine--tRNA ligase [Rhodohalobacter sulfatireducens]
MSVTHLDNLDKIVSLSKARGFIFQSSDIYGGLGAVYDYGPLGAELKRNIQQEWWKSMTQLHDNIVGLDAAIFMHPRTWEASGHVEGFNDPMIDDKQSNKRYRADMLIEQHILKLREKGKKDKADEIQHLLDTTGTRKGICEDLYEIIMDEEIRAPESGAFDWTEVRQFNLMFKTHYGATSSGEDDAIYLRPETAQGIFVNYKNVMDTARVQVPFGIAQIGKAFRNEVVARQFVFRMREFEQMEMQYFVEPGTDQDEYEKWLEARLNWHKKMGVRESNLRTSPHPPDKLAHYARAAADIQYKYPIGWQEVEGIHNRTDFDLSRHQEYSGKKMEYYDQQKQERYIPYVIETSVGLDRTTLMILCDAYREEEVDGDTRTVLKMNPKLAPTKIGIFPLIKKDKLQNLAKKIEADLRDEFNVLYDESGSIGKRYRRQDEAGTPFCVTVDFDGVESDGEDTVTIRYRDDMTQDRIPAAKVGDFVRDKMKNWSPED